MGNNIKYNLLGEMTAEFQLCKDRHPCPVEESLFENTVSIMAFSRLEILALNTLLPLKQQGLTRLVIYTSGCTSALLAAINVAQRLHIRDIEIKHWDRNTNDFQTQHIVTMSDVYL